MVALSTLLAPLVRRTPALDLAERKRRLERTLRAQGVSSSRAKHAVGCMRPASGSTSNISHKRNK